MHLDAVYARLGLQAGARIFDELARRDDMDGVTCSRETKRKVRQYPTRGRLVWVEVAINEYYAGHDGVSVLR